MLRLLILWILFELPEIQCEHYKGGTVTWKPTNPNATGSTIEILISEKHSFTLGGRYACSQSTINNQLSYYDANGGPPPDLTCKSGASCSPSQYITIKHYLLCTDFSTQLDSSSGSYYEKQNLSSTTNIDIAFEGSAWASEIRKANGASAGWWYVGTQIRLGTVYPINSSPGKNSLLSILIL